MSDLTTDPLAWRPVKAPSLVEFEVLADDVYRRLPKGFRDLCANVVIQIDDFPTRLVLAGDRGLWSPHSGRIHPRLAQLGAQSARTAGRVADVLRG
ncbi:MAG: hypothetical protein WBF58_11730, partial [Xanthobacteraceae bacterium]